MKTAIILFIAFNTIVLVVLYTLIYLNFRKLRKKTKPNVFIKRTNTGCYQPNIDFTTNPPCNDKRFLESELKIHANNEYVHDISFMPNEIIIRAINKIVSTASLVRNYRQAIEDENYELAGKLHKRIEALKNENTAHND